MKLTPRNLAVIVIGVVLIIGILFATGILQQIDPSKCRIMKPLWGFYRCDLNPKATKQYGAVTVVPFSGIQYKTFRCDELDIAQNTLHVGGGLYKSCSVTITSDNFDSQALFYKTCVGTTCTGYMDISGSSTTEIGSTLGKNVVLDFGQRVVFQVSGIHDILRDRTINFEKTYRQKYLIYKDWFGMEMKAPRPGCDLRAISLDDKNWDKLPLDAITSMDITDRQNFVINWIDLPNIGNYFNHPTYGNVVCQKVSSGQNLLFRVKPYETANSAGEIGIYVDNAGNCYLIPEKNYIAEVECCPGETLVGYTCSNEGKLVPIDRGECCRGGLCSVMHCPGQGGEYCDISTHKAKRYECDTDTGACEIAKEIDAECCPPDYGCAGNEYCNIEYKCVEKPSGRIPCDKQCCVEGVADMQVYQYKNPCINEGMVCCPPGICKLKCEGVACNFNQVCEPNLGENVQSCPSDCKGPGIDWILIIIILAIVGVIASAIIKAVRKK